MSYRGVGPGIDVSHYGAPYQGMLGLGACGGGCGCGGCGMGAWTGAPSADPRMVKRFTIIKATWSAQNLPASGGAAEAAQRLHYQGRQLFPGHTVRKIGDTGWVAGGRVGYEVVLADTMRAGEIKQKNFTAGARAQAGMGGNVRFTGGQTAIPANGFTEAAPGAPETPEEAPSSTPDQDAAGEPFLSRRMGGLPTWGWGLLGLGAVGAVVTAVTLGGKPKRAPVANRRRRSSRRAVGGRHR